MSRQVSVVIPTFRRRDLLDKCLAALAAQTMPPDEFEVIVADDECSAATRELVTRWSAESPLTIRYLAVRGTRGPAAARNAGWSIAQAPVIGFTDDDCLPLPDWLRQGLEAFQPQVDAAWGRLLMPIPDPPRDYQRNASRLAQAEFVTANCFCRRSVLAATGGFDARFTAAWREDSDLYFRLLRAGYTVVQQREAIVIHPVRPARWGISLSQQKNSLFNALLYKKHPGLYRQRIQAGPPYRYYLMLLALLGAVAAIPAGSGWLLWLMLALWSVLYLRFCSQRLSGTSRAPGHILEMLVTSAAIPPLAVFWRLAGAVRFRVLFL